MSRISGVSKYDVRMLQGRSYPIPFHFTTDESGDETLVTKYRGELTISRATNTYTITFPASLAILAILAASDQGATLNIDTSGSTVSTAVLAFSGAFNSGRCDGVIWVTEADGSTSAS